MKTIESNSLIAYASQLAVAHPELTPTVKLLVVNEDWLQTFLTSGTSAEVIEDVMNHAFGGVLKACRFQFSHQAMADLCQAISQGAFYEELMPAFLEVKDDLSIDAVRDGDDGTGDLYSALLMSLPDDHELLKETSPFILYGRIQRVKTDAEIDDFIAFAKEQNEGLKADLRRHLLLRVYRDMDSWYDLAERINAGLKPD